MKRPAFIIFSVLLLAFTACQVNNVTNVRVADAYQSEGNFEGVKITLQHRDDNLTRVYFRIDSHRLLYTRDLRQKTFMANFDVRYELCSMESPKVIQDSMTLHMSDTLHYTDRDVIIDSFDVSLPAQGRYILQIFVRDRENNSQMSAYESVDNTGNACRQNFLLRKSDGSLCFDPWSSNPADRFILQYRMKNIPRLFVRYYKSDFPAALPPFIEGKPKSFSFKADSVFFIEMDEGQSAPLVLLKSGIYHIQTDTSSKDGFTFFTFYKGFPEVTTPYQMLNALRYITSKTEYNDMSLMKNRKQAVDDFWLDVAGNPERAKEMIRKYYGRVTGANRYFTSYQEGWKTDRGMIFIVFGPPGLVYRNPDSETWIYGEDRNMMSITFNFSRVNNVFSDNDFEMNRSQEYKELWYSALEGWRN